MADEAEPKENGDLSFSGVVAPVFEPVPKGVDPPLPKSETAV